MENLENAKVGDVMIYHSSRNNPMVAKVERVTKTFIMVRGVRFRKKDGYMVGYNGFNTTYITTPKVHEVEQIAQQKEMEGMITYCTHANYRSLPYDKLKEVYGIVLKTMQEHVKSKKIP